MMENKKYQGYTEGNDTLALVDAVVAEMHESWKMTNSPLRENPDEVSVLKFAGEGADALNARRDDSIKAVFKL